MYLRQTRTVYGTEVTCYCCKNADLHRNTVCNRIIQILIFEKNQKENVESI